MKVFLSHVPDMRANYYGERALSALREVADVRLNERDVVLGGAALAKAAAGCDVIVADRMTPGTAETFAEAPDLVAFLRCAVDVSTIDLAAASRHGVLVTHATPGFAAAVAEIGLGYMIDLSRGISRSVLAYRAGTLPEAHMGRQLAGSCIGIVGYGEIGRRLAGLAAALGMRVLVSDPYARVEDGYCEPVTMDVLLAQSDYVVCLALATPETENLFGQAAFGRMKPGAFFINLSRGQLVDEDALIAALDAGVIQGAAMDVGRAPDQKPSPELARRPDVIATPHTGGLTPGAVEHQAFDTVEQVRALGEGRLPKGSLNAEAATRLERLGIRSPAA